MSISYSAWLADREADRERLQPFGLDPNDDLLEARAKAEAAADRAFDHTPASAWSPL